MGLFQVVCMGLLAAVAQTQEIENCSVNTSPLIVGSTEDAAALAIVLQCSNGDFAVEWIGEVFVEETIRVTSGTSLTITGDGPSAIANGGSSTRLFVVNLGSSLHLSDMILTNGNFSTGGAIFVSQSTISLGGNISFISNSAASSGGAIYAVDSSTVSSEGDGTEFISNYAGADGGAIYAWDSTVFCDGDGTNFSNNSAGEYGGAVYAVESTVSWDGDGTQFVSNYANINGGAIYASESTVSWDGDGTKFSDNSALANGGAIWSVRSNVSWDGDGTKFISNSADNTGGALCAWASTFLSWNGDGTQLSNNSGGDGGAIHVSSSNVSWHGDGTEFSNNSAGEGGSGGAISASYSANVSWEGHGTQFRSNSAGQHGGGIFGTSSYVSWGENTTFVSNVAGEEGGALSLFYFRNAERPFIVRGVESTVLFTPIDAHFIGATFNDNSAKIGGAIYLQECSNGLHFTDVLFRSNSASVGGAVAARITGAWHISATFLRCVFSDNVASEAGGAVDTLAGYEEFASCLFEGNLADVGGAMRLGGTAVVRDCSLHSNYASDRGLAVAVVGSANISTSSFDGNGLYCAPGSYREDSQKEGFAERFETVCLECPDWDECAGCTIERGDVTPTCEAPLDHTTAEEPGLTLETLNIDGGYWRATAESDDILACYNPEACRGGLTGADSFCAPGYKGPYCIVCETGYSPSLSHTCTRCSRSRRQGLVAATVIAGVIAVFVGATVFNILLSTRVEEENIGCFRRRVLGAVPVQALKIIVVVWQILTQFADAANVTYPGVYRDFLNAIDVVNFDIGSLLAAGCLWSGIDFHGRLLVSTMGPLVVVGFLAIIYSIAVHRNGVSGDAAVVDNIRQKHQTALLLLVFLVYSSVSSMVFQTFACETLGDNIEYLRADYRIHCTDAKHKALEVYAGIMVFVYPVGIPLLYAVLLFQHRNVLADAGADKTIAKPIAGLWEAYRPERFYYEIVECGRRIMLTGVVVFIFPNDAAQLAITMLAAFFFSIVFEVLAPYKSESDMWLSRGGHVIVFLSMFDLLLLKVDVSGERDQSQAAFAGVLVAGHVLMILAIVVEVVGICYASGKKKAVEDEGQEAFEKGRVGSGNVPVFESAPSSWRSFPWQRSVSENTEPTRSIAGTVATMGEL